MSLLDRIGALLARLRAMVALPEADRRRRQALAALNGPPPTSVLVVCHGNLCRSPYAAAAMRRVLGAAGMEPEIGSAGFEGFGRPAPATAIQAASARGIDLSRHRSRLFGRELATASDLMVLMSPAHLTAAMRHHPGARVVILGDLDPHGAGLPREIADPVGRERAEFDACYARIDRCVDALAHALLDGR